MPAFFDGDSIETDDFVCGSGDDSPCFGCMGDCSECSLGAKKEE